MFVNWFLLQFHTKIQIITLEFLGHEYNLFQKIRTRALTPCSYGLSLSSGLLLHWCLSTVSILISSLRGRHSCFRFGTLFAQSWTVRQHLYYKIFKPREGVLPLPHIGAKRFQNRSWSSWSGGTISIFYLPFPKAWFSSGQELLLSPWTPNRPTVWSHWYFLLDILRF